MTSIELARELHRTGKLSKEAAIAVLGQREELVKRAMAEASNLFWGSFFKQASVIGDLYAKIRPGGAPAKAAGGFFSKFRHGGFTPEKPGAGPAAGWGDVGSNLLKMIGIAGLSAGATAGIGGLIRHKHDKDLRSEIEQSYNKMFDTFPRLKEVNPETIRSHFGILAKFAPSLAADPIVAGSFVQNTATMGVIDMAAIKGLAETQHRIDEMQESRSPFSSHFDRGISMAQRAMNPYGGSQAK